MLIEYLNLPKIPQELILSTDLILSQPQNVSREYQGELVYQAYEVNQDLEDWLSDNVPYMVWKPLYQLIYPALPIHRDFESDNIGTALNYVFDTGGENVITSMYDDDFNVIQEMCIEEHRWHKIAVNHLHGVKNVTKPRVMVRVFSITPWNDII